MRSAVDDRGVVAEGRQPVRIVARERQGQPVQEDLDVAQQASETQLVVAVEDRRIGIRGDLERPGREPRLGRPQARRGGREPVRQVARREAQRGVRHAGESSVAGAQMPTATIAA